MNIDQRNCVYVTGFSMDIDRKTLLTEFSKFGPIGKLYLEPTGQFAKVFYKNRRSAETSIRELSNSLDWRVSFDYATQNSYKKPVNNMANYNNDSDEDYITVNLDYCDVHGKPLEVLQSEAGDLFVNLKDIRKAGFALFRRDTYDSMLVDKRQIGKEFELHLLSEAKNYLIKNKVTCIDEEEILQTIARCKNKLLGENAGTAFGRGRAVSQTSDKNLTITSNVQRQGINSGIEHLASSNSGTSNLQRQTRDISPFRKPQDSRPPKTLPANFMPTESIRDLVPKSYNNRNDQHRRGERGNSRYNSVGRSKSTTRSDDSASNSSEPRNNFRKSRVEFESMGRTQRSPREIREEIPKITYEEGNTYDVTISYKEDKEYVCWIQDERYTSDLEEVIIKVNEQIHDQESIAHPSQGQLVAAEYDGSWNRGRVINTKPLMVHFLDYGNKSSVDSVRSLPNSLKIVPALATRVVISNKQELEEYALLKIKIKQKYEDGTYLVVILDKKDKSGKQETPQSQSTESEPNNGSGSTDTENFFFDIPKPLTELHDGDKVMVVDVDNNKFLVRTRECTIKNKAISEYIKNMDKCNLTLPKVKVGQLVLCSRDGYIDLFRAVVSKLQNAQIATVKYIDFPGEADLSVSSLRNVDEFLAGEPCTILLTPMFEGLEDMSEEVSQYVMKICENKEKFTVVLSKGNFDLRKNDGSLLSNILDDLEFIDGATFKSPVISKEESVEVKKVEIKAEPLPTPSKSDKVLYDDMDWIKLEPGSHTLMCYCLQDIDDITFLSSSNEVMEYLETITNVDPADEEPYKPEPSEMCLVMYKGPDDDEASWYRAVVFSEEEGNYTINFVDFGNVEVTTSKNIRKFPTYLKDIPILGIGCQCAGLPKKPEILVRLKELVPEGTQVNVLVKGLEDLKYQVELPELYKQLKAEKLF